MSAAMNANRGAKIILHSLERSRSQRILWLLTELNLTYEIRPYKRDAQQRSPPSLKDLHPLGKAPVLSIAPAANKPALLLAESAVIVEYLVDHFPPPAAPPAAPPAVATKSDPAEDQAGFKSGLTTPPRWEAGQEGQVGGETEAWLRYRYLMHYAEGSLMPLVVTRIVMDAVKTAPAPFFVKPLLGIVPAIVNKEYTRPNLDTHFTFLEGQLTPTTTTTTTSPRSYLTGSQFTPVDILMSYPLVIADEINAIDPLRFPRLKAYVQALREMEGYRRAVRVLEDVEGQKYRPF
ncbi:glutathione S-transferase [Aspergillus saccharolyticus JOP 1030-1]|uniref:Putative glutathione S-transferase n=1 Tax=Aspergillus saccharolyticus JOP 1030-1 TaxID=1450539 RepID=A0A318ZI48_9EURO|nr:putative glutathione S-transferase [Aspergillus saccharolyticus JOP 1030-1]PYH43370.1 putative glutathione S-transferase [Aspergillus saccharolyticus JOP 1030-1]